MRSLSLFFSSSPDRSPSAKRAGRLAFFLCLTTIVAVWLTFFAGPGEFSSFDNKALLLTALFYISLFIILSLVFSSVFCFLLLVAPTALLSFASRKKELLTGEPLIFGDITHLHNISVALRYAKLSGAGLAVLVVFFLLVGYVAFNARISRRKLMRAPVGLLLMASAVAGGIGLFGQYGAQLGVQYLSWDWPTNGRQNGLLVHLAQTSVRPAPGHLTDAQKAQFAAYEESATVQPGKAPPLFIEVLCESCWYDSALFRDNFAPLVNLDAVEMRGISPIFGGGTVNASFEMLTGLPTHNAAVAGILYQEYRDFFADHTSSLPSHLARNGLETLSAHNFQRQFWFRNVVEPKLGFATFYGIEDMNPPESPDGDFPRDNILFDFTLGKLDGSSRPQFVQLATVHNHGPYVSEEDDGGRAHYLRKIDATVEDIAGFVTAVRKRYPQAVVLVYGDHKPALEALVDVHGDDKHSIGDVPVLLFDPDKERAQTVRQALSDKPFYCYAPVIADLYYGMKLPVSRFTDDVCRTYSADRYDDLSRSVPGWIYSAALFDGGTRQ
ncbi:sulfatase-like hydrolase/transferase [Brucella anthropi]|uniref:sulfatase-like hydrolase/transferase n=1 Tax=Brucella anthropi TaxID=529 RepID=UPI00124F0BE2|nr:sulfatase-like hydrolase/transferase [Brucella anthropi]KAB2746736.1 sulfatase-like hydrolase/transferase [Brucella anthropi]